MSTRCVIEVRQGRRTYRIYRHSDGYPEGVMADLRVFMKHSGGLWDPEYFLANFIFYAKLCSYAQWHGRYDSPYNKPWEIGYGVCSKDCEHGDLDYKYVIDAKERTVKIVEAAWIQRPRKDWERVWDTVYEGSIEDAIKRFAGKSTGCHITEEALIALELAGR